LTQPSLVWYNALAGMSCQPIYSTRRGYASLLSLVLCSAVCGPLRRALPLGCLHSGILCQRPGLGRALAFSLAVHPPANQQIGKSTNQQVANQQGG
jgi:hypothetical protein